MTLPLLSLIGEQPIPVLLADRALKPSHHLLAHSERTQPVAEHLHNLLPHAELLPLPNAYDLEGLRQRLDQAWSPGMIFNLTSGTKPMAWAGYEVARRRAAPLVYLESEKKQSILYRISFEAERLHQTSQKLPGLITLKDYLLAHGLTPVPSNILSNAQEVALQQFLVDQVDECLHNLQYPAFEIDFLVRRGNQAAVIEAKSGLSKNGRKRFGIDQLTTVTAREYLGIYTGRIWVVAQMPGQQLQDLAKAYQIEIVLVELSEKAGRWRLNYNSQNHLAQTLDKILGVSQVNPTHREHL
ncbi:MAG: hypothetical protein QME21_18835 [Anaerolineales bacterium]|jgi:hypothetical protein|nr:hypothetical protein [Anaerolineales bacterium]